MDWLEFLSFLLSPLELGDSEPVVVYGTEYLQQVSELINRTEPRCDWGTGGGGVVPWWRGLRALEISGRPNHSELAHRVSDKA